MEKLKMHSISKVDDNIEKIGNLFPNCVTEAKVDGKLTKVVDFDKLKQELSDFVVEGRDERYQFTWPDKKQSILLANAPIAKTLRPCVAESVDFDSTQNLYIEGDNLDVLKLLQETYLGKVKMIYIDPPYNTGNDFVYEDDFAQNTGDYLANSGQFDEEGNKMVPNPETNGRFHTDWLNMIYPRLKLAKDLLSEDGVIFISIDDGEIGNLRKVCDEIYGTNNFLANLIWEKKYTVANDAKFFSDNHDHILCYSKNISNFSIGRLPRSEAMNAAYKNPDKHIKGVWKSTPLHAKSGSAESANFTYVFKNGVVFSPPSGTFSRYSAETFKRLDAQDEIWFGKDGMAVPSRKTFLCDLKNEGVVPRTIIQFTAGGHNHEAVEELKSLLDVNVFTNPKPTKLIKLLATIANLNNNSIILDFFSGSATTAHAVMKLNAEDGGNRKFIMVQIPESTDEKSEAYKAGYPNICEIGKERIRRAGKKIKEDNPEAANDLDTGFRVLKLASTNMKDVFYTPEDTNISMFSDLTDNIKADRSPEDLLFQVMLDLGVLLSSKIETSTIDGKNVFRVADGFLMACFDKGLSDATITAIAKMKPYYFVIRDHSMATDAVAANFDQIFAAYSPDTVRKVL
ncbi:MAG: site-specific DNA-methyltransferase [Firmicutes bacterium]|nr:site-specific DNA-methyltransferase [Bacillota bacterium]